LALGNKVSFKSVIDKYEVIFFDAYGVLNDAGGILPGVTGTLKYLNEIGKPYFVVSNDSSNMPDAIARKYLDEDRKPLVPESRIISSGMIAANYIEKMLSDGHITYFGEEKSAGYLASAKKVSSIMEVSDDDRCDAFVLLGCGDVDWRTALDKTLNYLRLHESCELLAPNPDLIFYAGSGKVGLAAGSLAAMLEGSLKRKFKYFGKPHKDIFEYSLEIAKKEVPGIGAKQVLMVGDNLDTDILGAQEIGLDSFLVMSGNTKDLNTLSKSAQVRPTYVGDSISIG